MKVLIDIRIKYFVLLLIVITIGCTSSRISTRKPEKYKSVLCSSIEKREGAEYPGNLTDTFTIGDGKRVNIYTNWYDLEIGAETSFRFEWYQPNGEILGSYGGVHKTISSSHYTVGFMSLDYKYNHPPGVWTVEVYVNNHYIFTKQFTILED
jgi:hypothetical protein